MDCLFWCFYKNSEFMRFSDKSVLNVLESLGLYSHFLACYNVVEMFSARDLPSLERSLCFTPEFGKPTV